MSIEEINSLPVNREAWYNVIRHDTRRSAHRLPYHIAKRLWYGVNKSEVAEGI